jgi:tRNA G18 (ribose-2'-O)-methylase SpoU
MSEIAGFYIARGCLAYTAQRIVTLDGIGDTANLGSIIQTASCLGLDALLLSADSCDCVVPTSRPRQHGAHLPPPHYPSERSVRCNSAQQKQQEPSDFVVYAAVVSENIELLDQMAVGT